jgi:hypothetical protein
MKTIIMAFAILLASTATFAQAKHSHKHHHSATAKKYTCSMHPEVVMNKPGKCSKCNMALVPMKKKMDKKEMGDMKMDK